MSGTRSADKTAQLLLTIYQLLREHFGFRNWWPGENAFEVMVGAILAQNTSWKNVEKAISNLKKNKLLNPQRLAQLDKETLAQLVRPSGYYNQKALKLQAFLQFFLSPPLSGSIEKMKQIPTKELREMLLAIKGIGPETADSILLYALDKPVFVVDAYTRRIFSRLGLVPENISYDDLQSFLQQNLPCQITLYNDYHAQLVELGKNYCKKKPLCQLCPLKQLKRCL